MHRYLLAFVSACIASLAIAQAQPILEQAGDFVASNFRFDDGSTLDRLTLHYVTLGTLRRDANGHVTNAVLLLHDTTGSSRTFLSAAMRRELFAPGQPLDAVRYFIVIPDAIGHGASSKPSDGLRMAFPQYDDGDAVAAQYLLVTQGLGIDHLRLVLGTTMGGSETWLWGERHPRMMDALMPIASQPVAVAGRNGFWRQMIVTAIRRDPGWQDGRYTDPPLQWLRTMPVFTLMTGDPARMQERAPNADTAAWSYDVSVYSARQYDANDVLYWFEASRGYDPEAALGSIEAPLFAVNFADDETNPVALGVMQRVMPRVAHGRFVEVPAGERTWGASTIEHPEVWKPYLDDLLRSLPPEANEPNQPMDSKRQQE